MIDKDTSDRPRRRTALIDMELENIKADITALQEVRLSDEGHIQETERTFFWKGCPAGQPRRAGVAFAIRNQLGSRLEEHPRGISERIMTLRIRVAQNRYITLINVYAPTMTYPEEEREAFYAQLRAFITSIPAASKIILLGDFNARVGSDHETWAPALGKFGRGQQNSNGELLAGLCVELDLAVTNTFFQQPDNHYFSWIHPRSKRPHLLDYVITRRKDLKDIRNTRAMRGPDCHTDHYLVKTTLNLCVKPVFNRTDPHRKRRLNTSKLEEESTRQELKRAINLALEGRPDEQFTLEQEWNTLSKAVLDSAVEVLGYRKKHGADWFNPHDQ